MGLRGAVLLAVVVLATACGGDDEIGACYEEPPRPSADAEQVGCDEARFEVVATGDLDGLGDQWPGLTEVSAATFDRCADAFEDYVGADVAGSRFDVWFDHPTEAAWADGERRIVCAATTVDDTPLEGSVEGREG